MEARQRQVLSIETKLAVARTMLRLADTYKTSLADPVRLAHAVDKARAAMEAVQGSLSTARLPSRERASIERELRDLEAELKIRQADGILNT